MNKKGDKSRANELRHPWIAMQETHNSCKHPAAQKHTNRYITLSRNRFTRGTSSRLLSYSGRIIYRGLNWGGRGDASILKPTQEGKSSLFRCADAIIFPVFLVSSAGDGSSCYYLGNAPQHKRRRVRDNRVRPQLIGLVWWRRWFAQYCLSTKQSSSNRA